MSIITAFKTVLARVARNIATVVSRLSEKDVSVSADGEIIVKEPAVKYLSDKMSAIVLGSAALLFLLTPIQGKWAMALGDQLLRAAALLWSGGTNESTVPQAGNA